MKINLREIDYDLIKNALSEYSNNHSGMGHNILREQISRILSVVQKLVLWDFTRVNK